MTAKVAGITFVLFTAAPAWAEWVKVGRTDAAVHYVDPASLSKDGNLRQVWVMQDMVEADAGGVRSIRALQEYDCAQQRFRYLSVAAHSGPMAGGWILATHEMRDGWSNRASAIGKMVCAE